MNNFTKHLGISLRLHFRNRMGLFYGFLFPLLFLIAFWVLYRYDQVPLVRHVGVLLTITALGGACFGLPTTMVSERERGVWRRYRLTPASTATLLGSTLVSRYLLLLVAALLQLALAMALGMPLPQHLIDLWLAFTLVAFAFLGMGLVIAMMADNVPAVQALGQCIFLPMLILGGVAVPLESLPAWAQHLSAFFPGRYAVEAIQASVTGSGLGAARLPIVALLVIGVAGFVAGMKLFRWDAQQRFTAQSGKGWVAAALAGWLAVGALSEAAGHTRLLAAAEPEGSATRTVAFGTGPLYDPPRSAAEAAGAEPDTATAVVEEGASATDENPAGAAPSEGEGTAAADGAVIAPGGGSPSGPTTPARDTAAAQAERLATEPEPTPPVPTPREPQPWDGVTLADIERDIAFSRLPPDGGIVTPIARLGAQPPRHVVEQMDCMRQWLPDWEPGLTGNTVQRVRNYLDLIALPDLLQMEEIESMVPHVVFERIREDFPEEELIKVLYWIAMNPFDGDPPQLERLSRVCLQADGTVNLDDLRVRTSVYAAKLLGRLTGHITQR